jgi:hypothetical protein
MRHTLPAVKQQCKLAANEMMGHGGWEKIEYDAIVDGKTGEIFPLICALKDGQIFESSGEELQKALDYYFPVHGEGTLEAFRESWEEHRRTEAEYRAEWGDQSGQL